MTARNRLMGFLFVGTIMLQNYESQISRVASAEIATWTAHDWVGAAVRILIAGGIAWKAFLSESGATPARPSTPPNP